jgi:hypothetical protein
LLRSREIDGLKLAIFGETGDREVRGRGAIDDRHNDARRQEGKRDEQADVPFSLDPPLGNLGERASATMKPETRDALLTEPDFVDPSPGLGNCAFAHRATQLGEIGERAGQAIDLPRR